MSETKFVRTSKQKKLPIFKLAIAGIILLFLITIGDRLLESDNKIKNVAGSSQNSPENSDINSTSDNLNTLTPDPLTQSPTPTPTPILQGQSSLNNTDNSQTSVVNETTANPPTPTPTPTPPIIIRRHRENDDD